jgi:hypothetical protein
VRLVAPLRFERYEGAANTAASTASRTLRFSV